MSITFKGCCLFKPSSAKTPSFSGSKNSVSRASAIIYENRSDIVAIRKPSSTWRDDEDRSVDDYLSQVTKSSLDVNVGSLKSVNSDEKHPHRGNNTDVVLEKCVSTGFEDRISKWVYSSAEDDVDDSFCKENPYQLRKSRVSTNKFLDLFTMCLWKCSTGCQDISDLN